MVRTKYTVLEKLNLFISVYIKLFTAIPRFSWWSPFFIFALFQALGLAGLVWYYVPGWVSIIYPILSKFLPTSVFHYPQYYLALPSIYAGFENFVLGPTVWIILSAAAIYRLGGLYEGEKPPFKSGVRKALRAYFQLLALWLIETILVILVLYIPSSMMEQFLAGSPNRAAVVSVLLQMVGLGISAMLVYAVPGIILDRKSLLEAVGDSIALFFRNPILTYLIVFIPSIIRIATNSLLSDYAPRIIELLNPDLIPSILLVHIFLGIFINLFIYGAAVFVYKKLTD